MPSSRTTSPVSSTSLSSPSTSLKSALRRMDTTDLERLARSSSLSPRTSSMSMTPHSPKHHRKSQKALHKSYKSRGHTYSTSSLQARSDSSLLRELAASPTSMLAASPTSMHSSSLAMSLGQCPEGKVYHMVKGRCVPIKSHTVAHHVIKHAIAKANAKMDRK